MFMLGSQIELHAIGGLMHTDDGLGQVMDGIGIHTSRSDGQLIITAVGIWTIITAGSGYRIMNGDRRGLSGVTMMIILAGRLFRLMLNSELILAFISLFHGILIIRIGVLYHTVDFAIIESIFILSIT
jgi:hypothetical protein